MQLLTGDSRGEFDIAVVQGRVTVNDVPLRAAADKVVSRPTQQVVTPGTPFDIIGTSPATDMVITRATVEPVGIGDAIGQLLQIELVLRYHRVQGIGKADPGSAEQQIVASAAIHGI